MLIYKLRISFTNKNIRKILKVLVAFLSNQKIGGHLVSSPAPFFSKSFDQNYKKAIQPKKKCKFHFNYSSAESHNQNMH